jgi:hypothetical protein
VGAEVLDDPTVRLKAGLINEEIHPVDALDLEWHLPAEDVGHGPW